MRHRSTWSSDKEEWAAAHQTLALGALGARSRVFAVPVVGNGASDLSERSRVNYMGWYLR